MSNNSWPAKATPSRLELFKTNREFGTNLMRDFNTPLKKAPEPKPVDKKAAQ